MVGPFLKWFVVATVVSNLRVLGSYSEVVLVTDVKMTQALQPDLHVTIGQF